MNGSRPRKNPIEYLFKNIRGHQKDIPQTYPQRECLLTVVAHP